MLFVVNKVYTSGYVRKRSISPDAFDNETVLAERTMVSRSREMRGELWKQNGLRGVRHNCAFAAVLKLAGRALVDGPGEHLKDNGSYPEATSRDPGDTGSARRSRRVKIASPATYIKNKCHSDKRK